MAFTPNKKQGGPFIGQSVTGAPDGYQAVVQPGFSQNTLFEDMKRAWRNLHNYRLWQSGLHADMLDGFHASDFQAVCAKLTSICDLAGDSDLMIYMTDANTFATTSLTSFARSILDDADAATVRATIGAGTGTGDVTAASNLTDNAIVRGDGGAKGVQTSGVTISDDDNIATTGTITASNIGTMAAETAADYTTTANLGDRALQDDTDDLDCANADATGRIKSSSASAGVGYAVGAGSTVTQATSKSTGVTINAMCGKITMHNATLNAGASVSFRVTNSSMEGTDVVVVNHGSATGGGTEGAYMVGVSRTNDGDFAVVVTNVSGGNLSEAVVINFAIIKSTYA